MKPEPIKTAKEQEVAILVGIITQKQPEEKLNEYLNELEFLAHTAGARVLNRFTQRMDKPDVRTFVGSGKLKQIIQYVQDNEIDIIIFDDELSPAQQRNLEKETKRKVMDRTSLILDIFAARAQTAHAKTQVELAQYEYLLPRLTGMWTHLDRIKGGIGMKGAGEKEIETDRRIVRNKIAFLKEKLKDIDKQMAVQRKSRGELVRVALVGYTNVGKSTVMNLVSKSTVLAENKLFATLDTTVRKVVISNLPFLLSDTVGFIRKLPTQLIESFKSTLDEAREADILLHVIDISHPQFEDHYNVVNETLQSIKCGDKESILVFNKIDNYTYIKKDNDDLTPLKPENVSLEELKESWMSKLNNNCIFISALDKINIDEFRTLLYQRVKKIHLTRFPFDKLLFPDTGN